MTGPARRLLAVLALLPDGIAHRDLAALVPPLVPEESEDAASTLRRVGLAFDQAGRLRALAPVREHVQQGHPPQAEDRQRAIEHYLELAKLGERAGLEDGAEAIGRLAPEVGNLEATALMAFEAADPRAALEATRALVQLASITGLLAATSLQERSLAALADIEDSQLEARCFERFGDLALYRSDHGAARDLYQQALPLFRRVGDVLGEANCVQRLGDIALARSDHDAARDLYQQALPLYRRVGDVRGEANCILRLGDIALRRSGHDAARDLYQEALPLYRRVGSVRGEANCILRLGEIALRRSDHDAAGDLYQQALPLYRRVGDVLGEANCIQSLGAIALADGDPSAARSRLEAALALYRRIEEPYSIGQALRRLARLAPDDRQRKPLVQEAKAAWDGIQRPDLVDALRAEFGDLAG
jgi:tetratricopeptide (TPR) repeat protein